MGFAEERGLEEALTRMGGEGGGGETSDRSVSFTDQDGRRGMQHMLCSAGHVRVVNFENLMTAKPLYHCHPGLCIPSLAWCTIVSLDAKISFFTLFAIMVAE